MFKGVNTEKPGRRWSVVGGLAAAVLTAALGSRAATEDAVPYPEGYRQWTHVSSTYVGPQSAGFGQNGGLHHIYANQQAAEGYRTGRFPEGSVIVADFLEPREKDGVVTDGPRRRLDVMLKNGTGAAGGWHFEQFKGDSRTERLVTPDIAARCVACHTQRKEKDFVFSSVRQ
jgi:cytochrome P460